MMIKTNNVLIALTTIVAIATVLISFFHNGMLF